MLPQKNCFPGFTQKKRQGSAIVIVILFLVLVSGLVLAFFSFSDKKRRMVAYSTEEIRTMSISRSAVDSIIRDLSDEIEIGSNVVKVSTGSSEKKIYQIKQPSGIIPSRSVRVPLPQWSSSSSIWSDNRALNLLKQSIYQKPFHSSGTDKVESRASSVNTTTPDLSGRRVSPSFWSKSRLMKEDFLLSEEQTPDWIYTTRSGENPVDFRASLADKTPLNEDYVLGRYAYQIYDVGGLLDMTVAGFHPQKTPTDTVGKKGGILMADLRSIPGLSDVSDSKLAELFAWRNKGPWEKIEGFFAYGERYGWKIPYATSDDNDNTFVSRSDLILYLTKLLGEQTAAKALPYLSNFERSLDIPSYRPHPKRPEIKTDSFYVCNVGSRNLQGGRNTAYDKEDEINPDISVLFNTDGTPKLKHRFPLSRLKFVKSPTPGAAPSSSDQKLAKQYFGLEWNYANNCWTIDDTKLKNLKDLNTLSGRPANFFEVLKAGINVGSLGQSRLPVSDLNTNVPGSSLLANNGQPTTWGGAYGGNETSGIRFDRDQSVNIHLLQIGANIIDQADEDGYPTHIQYQYLGYTYDIYGTENLPYPNYFVQMPYRLSRLNLSTPVGDLLGIPALRTQAQLNAVYPPAGCYASLPAAAEMTAIKGPFIGVWLTQVGIWNPHRPPSNTDSPRPTLFRVTADTDVNKTGTPVAKLYAGTGRNYWMTSASSSLCPNAFNLTSGSNSRLSSRADLSFAIDPTKLGTDPLGLRYVYANFNYFTPSENWIKFNATTDGDASFRMPFALRTPSYPQAANITAPNIPATVGANYSNDTPNNTGVNTKPPYRNMTFTVYKDDRYQVTNLSTKSSTIVGFPHGYIYYGSPGSSNGNPSYNIVPPPALGAALTGGNFFLACAGDGIHFNFQYSTDSGASWWTYAEMDRPSDNEAGNPFVSASLPGSTEPWMSGGDYTGYFPDPRTQRFESFRSNGIRSGKPNVTTAPFMVQGNTMRPGGGILSYDNFNNTMVINNNHNRGSRAVVTAFTVGGAAGGISWWGRSWHPGATDSPLGYVCMDTFTINKPSKMTTSPPVYYEDPDGIVRPGIGVNEQSNGGIGNPLQQPSATPIPPRDPNDSFYQGRPTILDRPFRSVAELGYVFRGIPWKHIDFSTPTSGDSALLDLFCVEENENNTDGTALTPERPQVIAGRVNLNTPHPEVIAALLRGGLKDQEKYLSKDEAKKIAETFIDWTSSAGTGSNKGKGPLTNVADLVGRLVDTDLPTSGVLDQGYAGVTSEIPNSFTATVDKSVKSRIESVVRSLSDGGQVRTWNLMIDLVTQSGTLSPQAKSLNDFNFRAEKHHWIHLAIDRITGEVVDVQWETVD